MSGREWKAVPVEPTLAMLEAGAGSKYEKRARNVWHDMLDAAPQPQPPAQEPDCWAVLTPNGSRLVSPDEAKGRKDAYPLYAAPPDLSAEVERLTACLKKCNDQAEHFEREWYLNGDEVERLTKERDGLRAALERLSFAAACRDNTSGDPCRLIAVKAELVEANKLAQAAIAAVERPAEKGGAA